MIHVVLGTKAQLIKMAPIMRLLADRAIPYNFVLTGQHQDTMSDILANFGLRNADLVLHSGKDIVSIPQMLVWVIKMLWRTIRERREIFRGDHDGIVLVHGDTFSTLLGAVMAKLAGLKVGHVESGLRSFHWLHPFPEEITRIATFLLSDVMFCPGAWAEGNLKNFRGLKINMGQNTLLDSLRFALPVLDELNSVDTPDTEFGIVTLHRFENFCSSDATRRIVECVERVADHYRLLFIMHKPTEKNLRKFGLYDRIARHGKIEIRPRYDYFHFIKLIRHAKFVVSDGGSNQEECYYLGKPVLLLRRVSERQEGIGRNVVVSEYGRDAIEQFLGDLDDLTYRPFDRMDAQPSAMVVDYCRAYSGTKPSALTGG